MKAAKKYHFEDYVEKANAAGSVEALFKVFVDAVKLHGLDRTIFSLSTDHSDIEVPAQLGLIHNYPRDWMDYYFEKGFDRIDPVLIHAASKVGMFEWKEIPRCLELRKKQRLCLILGEEAGLHYGLWILMRGPCNQTAGIALATAEKKDAFDGNLDIVSAYCHHFYATFKHLNERRAPAGANLFLTDKERDILSMVLYGKSDAAIADKLNMSIHTVDSHMRKIFIKLEVNNRTMAVVKALTQGLIHLLNTRSREFPYTQTVI
jgi:DNA-binding CsgD family transcriptional regulator